jgi:SulP family sulfate permease
MVAVFGLVDLAEVKHLWQVKRSDLVLLTITFFATLSLGIEEGIGLGVAASLLWFVVRTTRPHFAVLGQLPGTTSYRNTKNHAQALEHEGVLIVRMDAQFYFGNVTFLKERLKALVKMRADTLHTLVIDASAMNQLDSSAAQALEELAQQLHKQDIVILLANVKRPVKDVLERAHYIEHHGEHTFFLTVHDAVRAALPDQDSTRADTPVPQAA